MGPAVIRSLEASEDEVRHEVLVLVMMEEELFYFLRMYLAKGWYWPSIEKISYLCRLRGLKRTQDSRQSNVSLRNPHGCHKTSQLGVGSDS